MIHPEWSYSGVLYEMNIRQLTPQGTIEAARHKLPILREIGIDIIWLMPIYSIGEVNRKGSLGSYYSIKDYCDVNPEMGTIADFDNFLTEAHNLGFKVILDWVANHTSRDARWISEKPADWYKRDADGAPLIPWDWSDTAQLNYDNQEVWWGQIESMKFWLERGIDGFRCDMAMLVPIEFWQLVARELHKANPDIFMLAEAEQQNLFDGAFDACYGWELHHLMCDVAKGVARADAIRNFLYADRDRYPQWAMRMLFTSNHDENSWQGSEHDRFGASLEIMTIFSFIAPTSMPLIYTGQEVGYDHSFNFFDRDPIPEYHANSATKLYKDLSRIKHSFKSLLAAEQGGQWVTINNNAEDCLLILVRESAEDRVIAIMNLSPYDIHSHYDTGIYAGKYLEAFTNQEYILPRYVNQDLKAWQYHLLTKKK